ncbi:MAG: HWE histidine kinase domain-containing protein [Hyphomonadaceae bacterium]
MASLAAMADHLPEMAWLYNPDGTAIWFNKLWYAYTGATPDEMLSGRWRALHPPEHVTAIWEHWGHSLKTGEPFEMTVQLRGKDGVFRPFLSRARPMRDDTGVITAWFGVCTDISKLDAISSELITQKRLLETLNRTAASVAAELNLEAMVQLVVDAAVALTGAQFGAFFYNVIKDTGEAYTLYTISGVPRENFSKFPMPRNTRVFEPTFHGTGIVRSDDITKDPRYGHNAPHKGMPEGHLPVRSYLAAPVMSRLGEVTGGLFFGHPDPGVFSEHHEQLVAGLAAQAAIGIDNSRLYDKAQREIVERRQAEEERLVVLRELNHRVKNLFAVAVGMVTMTARTSDSTTRMAEALTGRLRALAHAHELIRPTIASDNQQPQHTSVAAMADRILAAHVTDRAAQLRLDGPDIAIGPGAATSLALILHELATNAAKYGALSEAGGRVSISWRIEGQDMILNWVERGGPKIAGPPAHKGFGADLARMSAKGQLGGNVAHVWSPEGVEITLKASLERLGA